MYDIRQFKPALYFLLILGISGFAIAAQSSGIWLVGMSGILLNAWLMVMGRFRPMPRVLANLITLTSMLYVAHELLTSRLPPVMVVGEFLVFLQLVKLWEQRANRDYAQLLLLSLLLMVAGSMNTASLWFGLILIVYLFLSLYCCLLFHLKVETDAARAAMPVPEEAISPNTLRQDQRHLARSMRRLTGLVSTVAIAFAVIIFVFFPRGSGAGLFGPLQPNRTGATLIGFSDQVSFQDVARIQQNHKTVAFVQVWHNDLPVTGNQTLLLRGLTLDSYRGPNRTGGPWEWMRAMRPAMARMTTPDNPLEIRAKGADRWRQRISLWPTQTDVLFAMAGPVRFAPDTPLKIRFSPDDGVLQTMAPLNEKITYEVVSSNQIIARDDFPADITPAATVRGEFPRIFEFARRPEVSGTSAAGPLADQRISHGAVSPLDGKIARAIESYLRDNFSYTLDLTDERALAGRDPIDAFLYDWKKGHCEYFAGAMTLMCQSLGMQARMVIGFRCDADDYNSFDGLYTVHQSDAHAWVEVKTPEGWKSFDPTSSREAAVRPPSGLLARGRHLLEYLEYTYANSVIAYDSENRESIIANVETRMTTTASRGTGTISALRDLAANSSSFWNASTVVLSGIMLLMVVVLAAACAWFLWERWRLRRRAQRIGIESLPEAEQLRLARQLGFYDDLVQLLDRHQIVRPAHYTPLEFSRSLTFLPGGPFDTIQRLTALFYRVRYGGVELPAGRQRRLASVLSRLGQDLESIATAGFAPHSH
jgi:protein-glutamine gamma-glutamyltransferase